MVAVHLFESQAPDGLMYWNYFDTVFERKEKAVLKAWWTAFGAIDKSFKKSGKIEESKIVSDVMKKGIETAYNYYGIPAEKVADKAVLMTSLLVFYVLYTLWWGFAIFYIFDGIGLTMTKAKVKKEA